MSIWDLVDFLRDAGDMAQGRRPRRGRDVSPEELHARAQEAQDRAEMAAMGASMLAFYKQDKKCASCKQPITEAAAVMRLINSEKGMSRDNVILVCQDCNKKLSEATPKEGL